MDYFVADSYVVSFVDVTPPRWKLGCMEMLDKAFLIVYTPYQQHGVEKFSSSHALWLVKCNGVRIQQSFMRDARASTRGD